MDLVKLYHTVVDLCQKHPEAKYLHPAEKVKRSPNCIVSNVGPSSCSYCSYIHGVVAGLKTTGCIMGQAIKIVDPEFDLTKIECAAIDPALRAILSENDTDYLLSSVEHRIIDFCSRIQHEQDNGKTWGEALEAAHITRWYLVVSRFTELVKWLMNSK